MGPGIDQPQHGRIGKPPVGQQMHQPPRADLMRDVPERVDRDPAARQRGNALCRSVIKDRTTGHLGRIQRDMGYSA